MLKTIHSHVVFLAAGFAGFGHILNAADAPNAPVGFLTETIAGGGSVSSPKLSVLSPTLVAKSEWEGLITDVSANGTGPSTVSVAGSPWVADQFDGANGRFYVEIVSAENSGYLADISTTATSSVVTADNLAAVARVGDTIKIRKHVTLGDFLGETNAAGLQGSDDPTTADEVLIYKGATATSYFYYTGSPGYPAGWYDVDFTLAPGEAAKAVIAPGEGVVVKRKGGSPVAFRFSGTAKTRNTLLPIWGGLNVVGTASAKSLTLATSGLYTGDSGTGITASDDPSTADEVTLYTPSGEKTYFYFSGYPGYPAGWYDSDFALAPGEADGIAIPPGTALAISRKAGPAFYWAAPSPTTF